MDLYFFIFTFSYEQTVYVTNESFNLDTTVKLYYTCIIIRKSIIIISCFL